LHTMSPYDGESGVIDFDEHGERSSFEYELREITAEGYVLV